MRKWWTSAIASRFSSTLTLSALRNFFGPESHRPSKSEGARTPTIAMSIDNHLLLWLYWICLLPGFDTVDHSLLLSRLSTRFGICDLALDWFLFISIWSSESKMLLQICRPYLRSASGFSVGSLAIFFVHLSFRWYCAWYCKISWSVLSITLCRWYSYIFWNIKHVNLLLKTVLKTLTFGC